MIDRERMPGGLNSCFWQRRDVLDEVGRLVFILSTFCSHFLILFFMAGGQPRSHLLLLSAGGGIAEHSAANQSWRIYVWFFCELGH